MSLYKFDDKTQIDEYGVNHSDFSLRDEIEYNARRAKEKEMRQLAKNYANVIATDFNIDSKNSNGYSIYNDKNYAWTVPHKYDHRPDNILAQVHNFQEINKERPIAKPITTGSKLVDFAVKYGLGKINPLIKAGINAYNLGYQGAGYYDNWQRAKEVGKYQEYQDY